MTFCPFFFFPTDTPYCNHFGVFLLTYSWVVQSDPIRKMSRGAKQPLVKGQRKKRPLSPVIVDLTESDDGKYVAC